MIVAYASQRDCIKQQTNKTISLGVTLRSDKLSEAANDVSRSQPLTTTTKQELSLWLIQAYQRLPSHSLSAKHPRQSLIQLSTLDRGASSIICSQAGRGEIAWPGRKDLSG